MTQTSDRARTWDSDRWRRTSLFAIVYFFRQTISQIRFYGQLVVSLGLAFLLVRARELAGDLIPPAILTIIAVAALRYWFFRFRIADDQIQIRRGIFKRTALHLPLDRIQAVNTERSLTDRLLGLVTVRVDTAGSGDVEATIPSVRRAFAEQLRDGVAAARGGRPAEAGSAEGSAERPAGPQGADVARRADAAPGEVIMKLPPGDMVRIGLHHLADARFVGPALVVLTRDPRDLFRYAAGQLGFLEPVGREEVQESFITSAADLFLRVGFMAAIMAVIAAAGIYGAFKVYHGFTLLGEGVAYRTRGGLFTRREVVVQSVKVQRITLSQNLVERWFRRYQLSAQPVSNEVEDLHVPLVGARTAEALRARLFGREGARLTLLPHSPAFARPSAWYIAGLTLKLAAVPALWLPAVILLFAGLSATSAMYSAVWALAWTAAFGIIALQRWRRQGFAHDDDGMSVRSGFIARKVDSFLFRKVQSVEVRQSPMQRRAGLGTLKIGLSGEPVEVPYIDHRAACRIRDYILYKVQSNPRWH